MLNDIAGVAQVIRTELDLGFRIIPFAAVDKPVASGIPSTTGIKSYLASCIQKALPGKWNPREDAWPDFSSIRTAQDADIFKTAKAKDWDVTNANVLREA